MTMLNATVAQVTQRIIARSCATRSRYLDMIAREADSHSGRSFLPCANLAHGFAGAGEDQATIAHSGAINLGIVTAYNDMLSAHQPYGRYPEAMKLYAREVGATAQVAGGVPAMCDGVTQGMPAMELSLFSRDAIAMGTAIALSHAMFDGMALLGICDKIVPGLLMGALRFGHLPAVFVPAGPMPTGLANKEKQKVRQHYAEGKASREELLASEMASYHAPGTCTFYGTANSNQMMMELMGLHMPGAAFIQPNTPLRAALTRAAVHRLSAMTKTGDDYRPLGKMIDEKAIVNAAVGLLVTGGSTNHAIHLPAIARCAGVLIDWQDLDELSSAVPLIARVYPNGSGDVNHFHAAGGIGYVIGELLNAGLVHEDVLTVSGSGLAAYAKEPILSEGTLTWRPAPATSGDPAMLATVARPFLPDGGMRLVQGNLGRGTFKTSAVDPARWTVQAPARVFSGQAEVQAAFQAGELDRDVVVVVRFQGPRANGMPELHKLTPPLGVLQDKGYSVALVTDGRMSGASGKVPAAIHVTPEALDGGAIGLIQDGDLVRLSAEDGTLEVLADLSGRHPAAPPPVAAQGMGREFFAIMRHGADGAEKGASAMLAMAGL
jgi:phosphogluconate dehydratase